MIAARRCSGGIADALFEVAGVVAAVGIAEMLTE